MNFVEEVLKITDNGVAVEKLYLFLTIHLLPVNCNAQLHRYRSKMQY